MSTKASSVIWGGGCFGSYHPNSFKYDRCRLDVTPNHFLLLIQAINTILLQINAESPFWTHSHLNDSWISGDGHFVHLMPEESCQSFTLKYYEISSTFEQVQYKEGKGCCKAQRIIMLLELAFSQCDRSKQLLQQHTADVQPGDPFSGLVSRFGYKKNSATKKSVNFMDFMLIFPSFSDMENSQRSSRVKNWPRKDSFHTRLLTRSHETKSLVTSYCSCHW